jgi:8-amino-7-oxononanoate synthase
MSRQGNKRGLTDLVRDRARDLARKSAAQFPEASRVKSTRRNQNVSQIDDFQKMVATEQIAQALDIQNPYFRVHDGHPGTTSYIRERECLNFSSYDYLGLNSDPRPAAAAQAAIEKYGVSGAASRMVAGTRPVHDDLEDAIARHYGSEAGQVFVSGHATNVSAISALTGEGDVVLYDAYIHNSVTAGIEKSKASRRSFPHNDLKALERILERTRPTARNILVVVEGLYSMDGDVPDLPTLLDLRDRFGFWLMVDEAHALGCVGATGKGSFEHFGIDPGNVDIWMGTLSKTLASTGGFIAGSRDLVSFLRYHADGYVYSVSLPPVLAASALSALEIMLSEPERAAKLQANAKHFQKCADSLRLDTGLGEGYGVMPIMVGCSLKATKLSERLLERDINVMPVVFPGVPMQSARLRFFLSADHSFEQIETALSAVSEELRQLHDERFGEAISAAAIKALSGN